MRDWAHSRRLGTPADEASYVVLRQPPASKLANLFSHRGVSAVATARFLCKSQHFTGHLFRSVNSVVGLCSPGIQDFRLLGGIGCQDRCVFWLRQYDSGEIRVGLAQAVQERSGRGAGAVIQRLDLDPHSPQGQG